MITQSIRSKRLGLACRLQLDARLLVLTAIAAVLLVGGIPFSLGAPAATPAKPGPTYSNTEIRAMFERPTSVSSCCETLRSSLIAIYLLQPDLNDDVALMKIFAGSSVTRSVTREGLPHPEARGSPGHIRRD